MSRLRFSTKSRALGLGLALVPAVACADGEEPAAGAAPPEHTPPTVLSDAGAPAERDAADDAPVTTVVDGCSEDGFCYEPIPRASPLVAVSASSSDDAWMLPDASGALYRWDGTSIRQVYEYDGANPSSITFTNVWAQTKDHVWAAARGGDGRLVLVRHASPPGGGGVAFRALSTDVTWPGARPVRGTPAGDALWIASNDEVLRIQEDESGAVVEHLAPTNADEDPRGFAWGWIWGFGPDDVYVAGKVCPSRPCGAASEGAIAHYDGTGWSITTVADTSELGALRGTPPATEPRQLWYVARSQDPGPPVSARTRTDVASLDAAGLLGSPSHSHPAGEQPACSSAIGQATSESSGWFSDGLLLCRWTGASYVGVRTAVGSRLVVSTVRGIWAGGADDVWIVGSAITRPGLPPAGFAARRTAETAEGASR